ncbi:MAG: pseudouridine-5'-phosphate glycosidase [Chloroflexota bacterium]|nr:pseudouridine-5'-phosphate glycosidase [Chloroflexota bacterium]
MALADRLVIAPEVAAAIAAGTPVVALESTLISHGLPYPDNVDVARASQDAVRAAGAVPATVAIRGRRVLVGLSNADLEALGAAEPGSIAKAARPTLAAALATTGWAATTVSATMIAAHAAGIIVFATGGIGGVHRGALAAAGDRISSDRPKPPTFDISSDLEELARTPMVVVCAGPKAILDVPATIEYLETRGVPVIAVGQADVPGFFARSSGVRAPISAPDIPAAARLAAIHIALGIGGGVLICVPVPEANALPPRTTREVVDRAVVEADAQGIAGPALTPWLLARVATLTEGASVRANRALIINNAAAAGQIARLLYA